MKALFIYTDPHFAHKGFADAIKADSVKGGSDLLPKPLYFITGFFKAWGLKGYDVLFVEGATCMYLAYWVKKFHCSKIIYHDADSLFYRDLPRYKRIKRRMMRMLLGAVDGVTSDSKMSRKYVKMQLKVPVEVTYPYIHPKKWARVKPDLNSKKIIYVGRLAPEKSMFNTMKAFKILKAKYPDAELHIIGDGNQREELEEMEIEGVTFHGFQKDPEKFMDGCSIGLQVSDYEPYGCAALEYAAAGIIPLLGDRNGANEVLRISQLVTDPDSPKAIAAKLAELFDMSPSARRRLQSKAKAVALKNTEKTYTKKFKEAFMRIFNEIN
ncbi:glycosyltransferase family 4 protein [Nanoarchaeota archaeon]